MKDAVICFTRVPRAGCTKTRLLTVLSGEHCAGLHTAFLRDMARAYEGVEAELFIFYAPDPDWEMLKEIFPMAKGFFPQEGEGLGGRMDNAIAHVLSLGYEKCLLTGSDMPEMGAEHIKSGLEGLEGADVVIGPNPDGGYYLIGMKAPCPELFRGHRYGGSTVYQSTLRAIAGLGLTAAEALPCRDVDTPEDLMELPGRIGPESFTAKYLQSVGIGG